MNIEQAKPEVKRAFFEAAETDNWPEALAILCAHNCTVKPSQAPKLKEGIRRNRQHLQAGMKHRHEGRSVIVTECCLEPDRDPDSPEFVANDWFVDIGVVEEEFPHCSTSPSVEYRLKHHTMMGDYPLAIQALRGSRLSIRRGGEAWERTLAGAVISHMGTLSGSDQRHALVQDARSVALRGAQ